MIQGPRDKAKELKEHVAVHRAFKRTIMYDRRWTPHTHTHQVKTHTRTSARRAHREAARSAASFFFTNTLSPSSVHVAFVYIRRLRRRHTVGRSAEPTHAASLSTEDGRPKTGCELTRRVCRDTPWHTLEIQGAPQSVVWRTICRRHFSRWRVRRYTCHRRQGTQGWRWRQFVQCPKRDLVRPFLLIENGSTPIGSLCDYSEARYSSGCGARNATS